MEEKKHLVVVILENKSYFWGGGGGGGRGRRVRTWPEKSNKNKVKIWTKILEQLIVSETDMKWMKKN